MTGTNSGLLYPLSHAQKRIWYNEIIHLNTAFASLPFTVVYRREIRFDLMAAAINHLIKIHDGLRIRLVESEENSLIEMRQYISDYTEHKFDTFDFSGTGGRARLDEWLALKAKEPFRLIDNDLFYFALIRFSEDEWGYFFNTHHIISDGWTINLIISQVDQLYQSLVSGGNPPEFPVASYLTYLEDEKEYLASEVCVSDRDYWLENLIPLPEEAALSFGRNRTGDIHAETKVMAFPGSLRDRMHEFGKSNNSSVFKLVLSALAIYINRILGIDDVAVASVNHGREKPDHRNMIGMFVNTFILRVRMNESMTFGELAAKAGLQVNETIRGRSRYPADELIREIREKTGTDPSYLMNIMLVGHPNLAKQDAVAQYIFAGYEISPLMIHINPSGKDEEGILELQFDFHSDLFKENDIARIFAALETILDDGLAHPEKKVHEIGLVPEKTKNMLLQEFNDTAVGFPEPVFIKDLFEEQVRKTPDKTAVAWKDIKLTYRELNEKANALARTLRDSGAVPDSIAGILMDRTPGMIVSVIAVIKAGCAYVPIDAGYPAERIEYILQDSKAVVLLSKKDLVKGISFTGRFIDMDDESNWGSDRSDPENVNKHGDLVYVIYTSGSTGKPKGVMIEHRSLSNFVLWHKDLNHLNEKDNVSKFASFGFDVTVIEIYPTLISGATLYIVPEEIRLSPLQVNEFFEENHITAAFLPTQFGEQFIDNINNRSLRWLEVAGEKMRSFRKRPYEILNGYGPTEYTVYTTFFPVERFYENIPIGKPLWNTRIYILDKYNSLRPVGIPGELCVAGTGIARGYLGRPELTAEKFIDDPFCPGEKMYRTGDLCRWLPDGNIEYMGRIDFQVKIRGFRVELGEIEQVMKSVPHVIDAVVVDRTDENGRKFLCGYIVSDQAIGQEILREKLAIDLPEYMIPQFIVQIEKIPLTPNGKIDRKALPEPERKGETGKEYVKPATPTEQRLAEIWSKILGVEKISRNDNFFDLGGHSLKAALLQARIQKDFRIQLSLQNIFHHAVLADLAALLDKSTKQEYARITKVPAHDHYPVSSAQKRLFIVNKLENIGITYNIPVVMQIHGKLDAERLGRAIVKMTERHESLRTSFRLIDGEPVQVVHPKVRIRKILIESGEENADTVIREFIRQFDLEKPPLFRTGLIRFSDDKHLFILDIHHIIFDGWSAGVFMDELWEIYEGKKLLKGKFQYRDYSAWQQKMSGGGLLEEQEKYWLEIFKDPVPVLNLETVFQRGSSVSFEGKRLHLDLDEQLVSGLRKIAREHDVTPFMLLLSAYSVLLSKFSGQEDVVIGIPSSGRSIPELEKMIGMFVNTLPIRTLPSGDKKFTGFLQEIRERVLDAYDNQDYQLDSLIEKLGIKRDANRNLLFDVMFAYRQQMKEKICEDLSVTGYDFDFNITKFDLTIEAIEREKDFRIEIEYRTTLFDEKFIRNLGAHLILLLGGITKDPEMLIRDIPMLLPEEQKFLFEKYNHTDADYPREKTVYELFEQQVLQDPDKIAVVHESDAITYGELNSRANQFAMKLRSMGVQPDQVVAVMMEQSIGFITAILGIVKAGGAYLPIDPEYPQERVQYILENSGASILVVAENTGISNEIFGGTIIILNREKWTSEATPNPEKLNKPEDLVYIIYTSGSTGKPKGVMITHQGLVNYLAWAEKVYMEGEKLDFPLYSSVAFDLTVTSIFTPLVSGNRIHVYSGGDKSTLIERLVKDNKTGIVKLTPSHLAMIEHLDCSQSKIRRFIVGGEELKSSTANRILSKFSHDIRVFNEYGPTETVVGCMIHLFDPAGDTRPSVPIGTPGDNVRIYILDKYLKPVPPGVCGEIYISGDGVARGYRNRPDITAERFLPDPFVPGKRMYKSGDLAKFLDHGEIEFLGRTDFQVKIHGFRIELGEIESRLASHPGIREAVVLPQLDTDGTSYLCAYYCSDKQLPVTELKSFLGANLPSYMIPSYFYYMDSIPVTPNGKVDRNRLPKGGEAVYTGIEYLEPRNEAERIIRDMFVKLLRVERVGVNDNFFDLGGNSLKAVSLVAGLQKNFDIRMNDVFKYQTVAQLAKNIKPAKDRVMLRLAGMKEALAEQLPSTDELMKDPSVKKARERYSESLKNYKDHVPGAVKKYKQILLTGATGFLGSYLLRDILKTTDADVYVPVRADTPEQAGIRLEHKLSYYFGKQFFRKFRQRITILDCDLSSDMLGMSEPLYKELAEKVDCIIHSAALVKHYGPYEEFYSSNVKSVENLISFAMTGIPKMLHHVSTLSVGMGNIPGMKVNYFTEDDMDLGQKSDMYYLQTKLEAEKLITESRKKGLTGNIYRIGNITFDSGTGKLQENIDDNAFYHIVRSFVNLGQVPDHMDEVEFSFVDQVSRAILALYDKADLVNETFHIRNSETVRLSEILTNPCLGMRIRKVAFREFIDTMIRESAAEGFREHIEAILLHFGWLENEGAGEERTLFMPVSDKTEMILEKAGFKWCRLDAGKMENMILGALHGRVDIFRKVPLFSMLSDAELMEIARLAVREHYRDESEIVWEGEPNDNFYVIEKGNIEISQHSASGWLGTVGIIGKNDFLAAGQLYKQQNSPYSAVSILGDAMVYSIPAKDMRRLIEQYPGLSVSMIKLLAERVDRLSKLFVEFI